MPNGQIATPVRKLSVTLRPLVGGVYVETNPENTGERQLVQKNNYQAYHCGWMVCVHGLFSMYPEQGEKRTDLEGIPSFGNVYAR